jgi:hypothetical protein
LSTEYHLCTYFDINYLPRALALYNSLRRHAGRFRLYALCLDDATHAWLSRPDAPEGIVPIALAELEAFDPELLAAKATRSRVEYYFTCTAAFQLFLLEKFPAIDLLTYLDADLYFYSSPAPIFEEMGESSILIVGHRFPAHLRHLEEFGIYNVGLLTFRNNADGRACLEWWRARCIEWCYDRLEDGKFGDQKYLDDWPERFRGVKVLAHKGANLAPWNLAGYEISERNDTVMVDEMPLIFYHFHKLKMLSPNLFDTGLTDPRARLNATVRRRIFAPYLRELRSLVESSGAGGFGSIRGSGPARLRDRLRLMIAHKMLMTVGPLTAPLYLGAIARPLIELRRAVKRRGE